LDPIEEFDCGEVTGAVDWTKVTTDSVDAPSGARCARIHCTLTGRGSAWFDDIYAGRIGTPTIAIAKSDAPDPVKPGRSLVYTVAYSNIGDGPATDCVITETYDENVGFDDAAPPPEGGSAQRVWRVDALQPGDSDFIVITVTVNSPLTDVKTLTNWVEMDCKETVPAITATTTEVFRKPKVYLPLVLRNFRAFCNGGFETGDFACWTHGGEMTQSVQSARVYQGACAALLGNPDYPCRPEDGWKIPVGEAWMCQTFSVPSCLKPELSFKYRIFSNDVLSDAKWDSFDVRVNGSLILRYGNDEWDEADCDRETWDSEWKDSSDPHPGCNCDLSAHKGENAQVCFQNESRVDHYYNTWTYVDQVAVTCK